MTEFSAGERRDLEVQTPKEVLLARLSPYAAALFKEEKNLVAYGFDPKDEEFLDVMTAYLDHQGEEDLAAVEVDSLEALDGRVSIDMPGVKQALDAQQELKREAERVHGSVDLAVRKRFKDYSVGGYSNEASGRRDDMPESETFYGGWRWGDFRDTGETHRDGTPKQELDEKGALLWTSNSSAVSVYDAEGNPMGKSVWLKERPSQKE